MERKEFVIILRSLCCDGMTAGAVLNPSRVVGKREETLATESCGDVGVPDVLCLVSPCCECFLSLFMVRYIKCKNQNRIEIYLFMVIKNLKIRV